MKKSQLDMYIEKQSDFLKEYNGKIIAVKDGVVQGAFETKIEAYRAMRIKGYNEGEFIIIRCAPGDSEYTARFANTFIYNQLSHA
jgi:hypothetical protein